MRTSSTPMARVVDSSTSLARGRSPADVRLRHDCFVHDLDGRIRIEKKSLRLYDINPGIGALTNIADEMGIRLLFDSSIPCETH